MNDKATKVRLLKSISLSYLLIVAEIQSYNLAIL